MTQERYVAAGDWRRLLDEVRSSRKERHAILLPDGRCGWLEDQVGAPGDFVLYKGSFAPMHRGHVALFEVARRTYRCGRGAFALSFQTSRGSLSASIIAVRGHLIRAAGYSIVVSRTGLFADDALLFRELSDRFRVIFPLGSDVLFRVLDFYSRPEFNRLFANAVFAVSPREGVECDFPAAFSDCANIHCLGAAVAPQISSTRLRQLRLEGAEDAIREAMPASSADMFMSIPSDGGPNDPWLPRPGAP